MGCGKSKVAIDLIASLLEEFPEGTVVLIICPLRVCEVWREQLKLHASFPYFVAILDDSVKGTDEKQRIAQETIAGARSHKRTAISVVNYESAWLEPFGSWALTTAWGLVIADELHRAKRPSGRIARFMAKLGLRALFRLGLSGTPVPHSFLDLWAQLEFLDPTIFNETYTSHK